MRLTFDGLQILVFGNRERFHDEAVRVVVAACGVQEPACGYKTSDRQAAFPDNKLPGIGSHLVGVLVEVAFHAVNLHRLVDVARKPGRSAPLRELSPLRTVHESFLSYGSSNSKFLL